MNAELLTTAHSYLTQMSIHAAAYRTLLGERDADEDSYKNAEIKQPQHPDRKHRELQETCRKAG